VYASCKRGSSQSGTTSSNPASSSGESCANRKSPRGGAVVARLGCSGRSLAQLRYTSAVTAPECRADAEPACRGPRPRDRGRATDTFARRRSEPPSRRDASVCPAAVGSSVAVARSPVRVSPPKHRMVSYEMSSHRSIPMGWRSRGRSLWRQHPKRLRSRAESPGSMPTVGSESSGYCSPKGWKQTNSRRAVSTVQLPPTRSLSDLDL
jgi:hypothetical protein